MAETRIVRRKEEFDEMQWGRSKEADLGASYGVEKESGVFWGTSSHLEFRSIAKIAEKSLEAHGYETNLENILYCLETLRPSRLAEVKRKDSETHARGYEKVLSFEFPKKGKSGFLLQMLYGLIDSLTQKNLNAQTDTKKTKEEVSSLKKKLEQLTEENNQLKHAYALLESEKASVKAVEQIQQTLSSVSVENQSLQGLKNLKVEACQVKEIIKERHMVGLKVAKRSFEMPFSSLSQFPSIDCWGVALIQDGAVTSLVPVGEGWTPFEEHVGEMLASSSRRVKVRTRAGQEHVLSRVGLGAVSHSKSLRRGDAVVVRSVEGLGVDFHPTPSLPQVRKVKELQNKMIQLVESEQEESSEGKES